MNYYITRITIKSIQ